jgi:ATP-dependent DNA ligase
MIFPTLFKKTNTGAIQQWKIWVVDNLITTEFGQVDGKLQITTDVIREGKNAGKANATTPEHQAIAEATSKWEKQKKKRYVETIEEAKDGKVDTEVIKGGIAPMLAPSKVYPTFKHKLKFPVYLQPKLDGSRLIAVLKDGVCTLWSRTQKQVHSLPHIERAVENQFGYLGDVTLDGEAYSTIYHDQFEELMSLIRQDEPGEGHEVIDYHIYDCPSHPGTFKERYQSLTKRALCSPLVLVETTLCQDDDAIMACHEKNLEGNYEGSMIRNDGPYEFGKRSYHLQKLKGFQDQEYVIIGAEEGRGKDTGTVGAFLCETEDGKPFKARLKATYERRRALFENPSEWKGMLLTVKFQNLTKDGIPRFPIGKGLRKKSLD